MSLSTQSETSSQSVTPTSHQLSEKGLPTNSQTPEWSYEHKRKLSKADSSLQAQVRGLVWDGSWSTDSNIVEDAFLPYYGSMHRQLQMTTSLRKESRRPLANPMNSKRLCSLQHSSSTPTSLALSEPHESNVLMCRWRVQTEETTLAQSSCVEHNLSSLFSTMDFTNITSACYHDCCWRRPVVRSWTQRGDGADGILKSSPRSSAPIT